MLSGLSIEVINQLLEKYGKDKSFKDEELFTEIVSLTTPKVGEFLNRYVAGPEKIPYVEILGKIGIKLESIPYAEIDLGGGFQIGFNRETFRLKITSIDNPDNKFLKDLGIKQGDELVSLNGNPITYFNIKDAFGSVNRQIKSGDNFEMVVARNDLNGDEKKETLTAKISKTKIAYDNKLSIIEKLNDRQQKIKNTWLGK